MKKILSLFLSIVMVFSLAVCGQRSGTPVTEPAAASSAAVQTAPQEPSGQTADGNILVAYFSWADNAVSADDVDAVTAQRCPAGKCAAACRLGVGGDRRRPVCHPGNRPISQRLGRLPGQSQRGAVQRLRPALEENVDNIEVERTTFREQKRKSSLRLGTRQRLHGNPAAV